MAEINVVPLVDVMLVLLIIFMVTAPMLQQGIDVSLPVSKRSTAITDERIFVTVPLAYRQNHKVRIGDEPVSVELLAERIRQATDGRPDRDVFLRGDGGILLQELVEVVDRLKEAGVEKVGIILRPPEAR
jgi:biopolymer transport protein ExbD